MKNSIKRTVSSIIVFAVLLSVTAMCFSFPANAASVLKNTRSLLGEYISELYLKGPSVSSSVRENLISKGLANDGLLEKRAEFDLRLCSSDEYNGYFFTDKEQFLSSVFGENGTVFLDGIYIWYPSVSAAKRASAGPTQNDPLIKYNISNALNFAIDVYGMCGDDDGAFSDEFNDSRKDLASYAIDCIYRIIKALEDQIGEGTSKPTYYRKDYSETFCTQESGLYPYLDERFRKNTPVMTGYLDSSSFTKKTFSYDVLNASIDTAARLTAFETAYSNLRAQKDGKTLYYDFLTSFDRARHAYNDLCSIVLSGENANPDIAEKAVAYMKLKSLGDIFAKYILPYSDDYSTDLNAMSINYTTIKTLIFFVDDNPYFLNFISLAAMQDLAENFTQSVSRLSPMSDRILSSADVNAEKDTVSKLTDFVSKYEGVSGDTAAQLYERASAAAERLKNVAGPEVRITVPSQNYYSANAAKITTDPFTFTLIPSKSLYAGLIDETRAYACALAAEVAKTVPVLRSETEREILPIEEFINSYSFIFGTSVPPVCPATGKAYAVSFTPSSKAILKKILASAWKVDNVDDARIFSADKIFNAAEEYCDYKKGNSYAFLTSSSTADLYGYSDFLSDTENMLDVLKKSVRMTERDMAVYAFEVQYEARNTADIFRLTPDTSSGLYITDVSATVPDGIDPANRANYKSGAFTTMILCCNDAITAINENASSAKSFVAAERFYHAVSELLNGQGRECFNSFVSGTETQAKQYYGSSDIAYEMFRSILDGKGSALKNRIVLDSNGMVASPEPGYKYFAFTVSAASADETRASNSYSFDGDRITANLITPLEVIVANRATYTGNYSRDFAEKTNADFDRAQLLVASVDRQTKTVGYEITVPEAEELLETLSQVNFTLSRYTLSYIASYKATALDALADKAKSKTIDQTDATPYYKLLCELFRQAYSDALNVSYDKTVPTADIDYAAENLSKLLAAIEEYEKPGRDNLVTVKNLDQKISEAQALYDRYDLSEPNMFVTDLGTAVADAKAIYAAKLSTFTAEDLKYEIKKLDAAILQAKNSLIIDDLMKKEIDKIAASVKSSSAYTAESWDRYSRALGTAELAAAKDTEKVSVCVAQLNALKEAAAQLTEFVEETQPEIEQEDKPEETQPEQQETADDASDAFLKQANDIYAKSVSELAEYTLSSKANAEKIAAWTAALSHLKEDLDAGKAQQILLSDIIAVQLAKDIQIANPETNDN